MKLIIASNNAHKIREIKTILSGKFEQILSLRESGIEHETVEDGKTFMENALKKAREISEISGCAALADDSGISAHALGDEPGIFSARYAGVDGAHGADAANNALLVKNLADKEDKGAHYTCAIALVYPDGREIVAQGRTHGKILFEEVGENGFGYDCLFFSDDLQKSFAVASAEEKNSASHRYRALCDLKNKVGEIQ